MDDPVREDVRDRLAEVLTDAHANWARIRGLDFDVRKLRPDLHDRFLEQAIQTNHVRPVVRPVRGLVEELLETPRVLRDCEQVFDLRLDVCEVIVKLVGRIQLEFDQVDVSQDDVEPVSEVVSEHAPEDLQLFATPLQFRDILNRPDVHRLSADLDPRHVRPDR